MRHAARDPPFFRVSAGPGWALAGDARHHKAPFIARGATDAFRGAELIADAVTSGWDGDLDQTMTAYPAERDGDEIDDRCAAGGGGSVISE